MKTWEDPTTIKLEKKLKTDENVWFYLPSSNAL